MINREDWVRRLLGNPVHGAAMESRMINREDPRGLADRPGDSLAAMESRMINREDGGRLCRDAALTAAAMESRMINREDGEGRSVRRVDGPAAMESRMINREDIAQPLADGAVWYAPQWSPG